MPKATDGSFTYGYYLDAGYKVFFSDKVQALAISVSEANDARHRAFCASWALMSAYRPTCPVGLTATSGHPRLQRCGNSGGKPRGDLG